MKKRARRGAKAKPQGLKPQSSFGSHAARRKEAAPRDSERSAAPVQLVQIEKPIYGGAFLARVEGKAVFVPLALPGEQARVRIVEDRGGYASAEAEEIVAAAPERIAPRCPHF